MYTHHQNHRNALDVGMWGLHGLGDLGDPTKTSDPTLSQSDLNSLCAAGKLPLFQCAGGVYVPSAGYSPYTAPPPAPSPTFTTTTPSGTRSPVQVPTLVSYLNDAAYSAMNIANPAAGGNLQTAIASVQQAAATYRALYPAAPYNQGDVDAALALVKAYYTTGGGSMQGGGGKAVGAGQGLYASGGAGSAGSAGGYAIVRSSDPIPVIPPSVSLSGGPQFHVGDSWTLTITGTPGAEVHASAMQNGASLGTTPYGDTDATGTLVLHGTMDASSVGQWTEDWFVAGAHAGTVTFSVALPTPAPTPPATPTPPPGNALVQPLASGNSLLDWLSGAAQPVEQATGLSGLALLVIGGGLLWWITKSSGGRGK